MVTEIEQQIEGCLCGSGNAYAECCQRYHNSDALPATAKALMCSRFTAFAMNNESYLLATWDGAKRPKTVDFTKQPLDWTRLVIVKCKKGGAGDSKGVVQFKAFYRQQGEEYAMNEISRFHKVNGRWCYIDGVVKSIAKVGASSDEGRNAPCSCGSGKKYKRCCGKQ